jgi:hypothetical protein
VNTVVNVNSSINTQRHGPAECVRYEARCQQHFGDNSAVSQPGSGVSAGVQQPSCSRHSERYQPEVSARFRKSGHVQGAIIVLSVDLDAGRREGGPLLLQDTPADFRHEVTPPESQVVLFRDF